MTAVDSQAAVAKRALILEPVLKNAPPARNTPQLQSARVDFRTSYTGQNVFNRLVGLLPAHVRGLCEKYQLTLADFAPAPLDQQLLRSALRGAKIDAVMVPSMIGGATGVGPQHRDAVLDEARELFERSFPPDEAEPWSAIVERNAHMHALAERDKRRAELSGLPRRSLGNLLRNLGKSELQHRYGDSSFHSLVVVRRDNDGTPHAAGYAQASTVPMTNGKSALYAQYVTLAESERGTGTFVVLSALANGLASLESRINGRQHVGIFGEAEYRGQADLEGIDFTDKRLSLHNHAGAKVLLLRTANGAWVSPHLQPRLDVDKQPLKLQMVFRPNGAKPENRRVIEDVSLDLVCELMDAFIAKFEREVLAPEDVADARVYVSELLERATGALLVPAERVPDYAEAARMDPAIAEQIERDRGSGFAAIDAVRGLIDSALGRRNANGDRIDVLSPRRAAEASCFSDDRGDARLAAGLRESFAPVSPAHPARGRGTPIAAFEGSSDHRAKLRGVALAQPATDRSARLTVCTDDLMLVDSMVARACSELARQGCRHLTVDSVVDRDANAAIRAAAETHGAKHGMSVA
jgi:hypothetical protein